MPVWRAVIKAALLKRLQRLEEVRAAEPRPIELQFGYLKRLPPDYTGERHGVSPGAGYRAGTTNGKSGQARHRPTKMRSCRSPPAPAFLLS